MDIGEAARNGDFELVVPLSILDILQQAAHQSEPKLLRQSTSDLWSGHMREVAAKADAKIYTVLHRMHLQVSDLQEMSVGQVLEIPETSRTAVTLTLGGTRSDQSFAKGRLGMQQKLRAVKLTDPPDPGFQDRLSDLIQREISA